MARMQNIIVEGCDGCPFGHFERCGEGYCFLIKDTLESQMDADTIYGKNKTRPDCPLNQKSPLYITVYHRDLVKGVPKESIIPIHCEKCKKEIK